MNAKKHAVCTSGYSYIASSKRGYERDDGPLSASQVQQIRKLAPRSKELAARSSLVQMDNADDSIS